MNDDIFEDNLGYWENRFWKDYGWIPRLDTQRGIDELQEYKRECSNDLMTDAESFEYDEFCAAYWAKFGWECSDDGESGQSVKLVPLA